MTTSLNNVELLAPAGNWEALEEVIKHGADAVYLGGKHFNMRLHKSDANFDEKELTAAVALAHANGVKLYIVINNLISEDELKPLDDYLDFLNELRPDALLIQDLGVLKLIEQKQTAISLHASVMMNTHNRYSIEKLRQYGVTRVVTSREMSLQQLRLLKEQTAMELEYFIHGDMCIAQSGQCYHSGIVFGQSSNRGRCLKPCRWPYKLIEETSRDVIPTPLYGDYKLALNDMCMYRYLPELIQAGVNSFKIEGRMRPAPFIGRIVQLYRTAIDRYLADPTGYRIDETDWLELYESRSRDFSTCYALGGISGVDIGSTGQREPRFFSSAIKEAPLKSTVVAPFERLTAEPAAHRPQLIVKVADMNGLRQACQNGADTICIGGETFQPAAPWTIDAIKQAVAYGRARNVKIVVASPRTTTERECGEFSWLLKQLQSLRPDAVMVSNPGSLMLAQQLTDLPLHGDFSFNVFNHLALEWLADNRAVLATISPEAAYRQIKSLYANAALPLALIVHGPIEAMIMDHSIPRLNLGVDPTQQPEKHYALLDQARELHAIRTDQYGRDHILLASDLCLYGFLPQLRGLDAYRLECQHYTAEFTGFLTRTYRQALDRMAADPAGYSADETALAAIIADAPRPLGCGPFRYSHSL